MNANEEKIRGVIAEEAGDWFVADEAGSLDALDSAALAAWLTTSPIHIEEFLGVSAIAGELKQARSNPEYSLAAILARAQAEPDAPLQPLRPHESQTLRGRPSRRWFLAAAAIAGCAVLTVGSFVRWNQEPAQHSAATDATAVLQFETRHGEQLTERLADDSVLHLNTDSAVSVRYGNSDRLVILKSGQVELEVAHDARRTFRVRTGSAEITDLGTKFDVRLEQGSTVVTVVEGRVVVGSTNLSQGRASRRVELDADQQIRVAEGVSPGTPIAVDSKRATAWVHRQIVFDHETLERVAAEYNRYTAKPIEIATPALRNLQISGVFATDDTDAFIAFLRSLKGVRVDVTAMRIRVSEE